MTLKVADDAKYNIAIKIEAIYCADMAIKRDTVSLGVASFIN